MRENAQKVTEESALESVVLFIVTGTMLWICRHVKALRRVTGREYRERKCADTIGTVLVPITSAKIYFSHEIYESNFIKQHSETAMV